MENPESMETETALEQKDAFLCQTLLNFRLQNYPYLIWGFSVAFVWLPSEVANDFYGLSRHGTQDYLARFHCLSHCSYCYCVVN